MKKFLIFSILITIQSVFAACSIDNESDAVCSLPEFRQQITPIFKQSSGTNSEASGIELQPLNRTDPIEQMRGPNNMTNYNSGCQFGVCLQNPKDSRLPDNDSIGN